MGCDIHVMLEYARWEHDGVPQWWPFTGSFNPGRDYDMFGIINGVRGGGPALFEKNELPADMSWRAKAYYYASTGEDEFIEGEMDADLHSQTWLTCDELAQVIAARMFDSEYPYNSEWDVLLVTMRAFEERGYKTRLLIAYDN